MSASATCDIVSSSPSAVAIAMADTGKRHRSTDMIRDGCFTGKTSRKSANHCRSLGFPAGHANARGTTDTATARSARSTRPCRPWHRGRQHHAKLHSCLAGSNNIAIYNSNYFGKSGHIFSYCSMGADYPLLQKS